MSEKITLNVNDTPHERARKMLQSVSLVDRLGLAAMMAEAVHVYMELDKEKAQHDYEEESNDKERVSVPDQLEIQNVAEGG